MCAWLAIHFLRSYREACRVRWLAFDVCAWHAIHFLRSCRGPALAELGHPDVAAGRYSGTALACATRNPFIASPRVGAQTPLRNHHRTQIPILFPDELSVVPHPSIPLPASAHTLPKPSSPRLAPDATRTLPRTTGRGMELVGERSVCSVATSGCPTRSEDGFPAGARNIPPRPAQPNSKQKASYREVGGVRRAADGNRTRVSGLGSVRSTIELQPHLFQCIAPACWG